jgi:hypothetical protein
MNGFGLANNFLIALIQLATILTPLAIRSGASYRHRAIDNEDNLLQYSKEGL